MSKQPNIRWRKSDHERLNKAVKNFNAKIRRLENSKPELAGVLPMRESSRELKKGIQTRADYNRLISKLTDFAQKDIDNVYDIQRTRSIKWTNEENKSLASAVKRFNAKIDRLSEKNPQIKNALPEKATVRQYKKIISSRNDLKRELKSLHSFLEKGAEDLVDADGSYYNLKLTKWQKKEMLERLPTINEKRAERKDYLEGLEVTDRGKKTGYTKGDVGMGTADDTNLAPMNAFTPKMTRTDLQYKSRNILKESQDDYWKTREAVLKSTYIRTLRENYKEKDIRGVINAIEDMDLKTFYQTFQEEGGKFENAYHPDDEQYQSYVEALRSIWTPNR